MNGEAKPGLLIVSVSVVGSAQPEAYYEMLDQQFQGCDRRHFVKLKQGVYLVNEDSGYPAILQIISYCNKSRDIPGQPNARLMVAELSESPIILSPEYQDVQSLIREMGRRVRSTRFPSPEQQLPIRPVQPLG